MGNKVAPHPYRDLMEEAKHEREVVDSPEAEVLLEAIFKGGRCLFGIPRTARSDLATRCASR